MSIEDLDYLYANSVKENIIVLVDSGKRDKNVWHEPNEFQLDFVEPFKYVYGVEILDVNVPRTMYGIDSVNNMLTFTKVDAKSSDPFQYKQIVLESRDYTIGELRENLNSDTKELYNEGVAIQFSSDSAVDENRKSVLEFVHPIEQASDTNALAQPFIVDIKNSTMGTALGFDSIAQSQYTNNYIKVPSDSNEYLFGSYGIPDTAFQHGEYAVGSQEMDTVGTIHGGIVKCSDLEKHDGQDTLDNKSFYIKQIVAQRMNIDGVDLEASSVTASIYRVDTQTFPSASNIQTELHNARVTSNGSVSVDGDNAQALSVLGVTKQASNILFTSTGSQLTCAFKDEMHEVFDVGFPIDKGVDSYTYYIVFDGIPTSTGDVVYPKIESMNVTIRRYIQFKLISPGIVTLLGDRYVTIHCDEIENHLRGSLMYNSYSPGLALVNLGVFGYSQVRNDFYSVIYKEFHPIGKLTNLKFSVKNTKGQLYNFRNVNWHMLVCIKYYVPKQKTVFTKSILNPNYNLDYIAYQIDKAKIDNTSNAHHEDTDEDVSDTDLMKRTYRQREQSLREAMHAYANDSSSDTDTNTNESAYSD